MDVNVVKLIFELLVSALIFFILAKGSVNSYLILAFLFIQFMPPLQFGTIVITWGAYVLLIGCLVHRFILFIRPMPTPFNDKMAYFNGMFFLLIIIGMLVPIIKRFDNYATFGLEIEHFIYCFIISYFVSVIDGNKKVNLGYVVKYYVFWGVFINFIVVILQRVFPQPMSDFMLKVYYTTSVGFGLNKNLSTLGFFLRGSGLVYTAVLFGAYCMIMFYMLSFIKIKGKVYIWLMIFLMGFFAFSKTFVIGILIGMLFFVGRYVMQLRKVFVISIGVILLIFTIGATLDAIGGGSQLYERKLLEFANISNILTQASSERYDASDQSSNQYVNYQIISQNLAWGAGYTKLSGAFLGDSTYVTVLYRDGIIGILIFLLAYFIIWLSCPIGSLSRTLLFVVSLSGFAVTSYDHPFFIPFFAIILSKKADFITVKK